MEYKITDEDTALNLLELLKTEQVQLTDKVSIIFDGWPQYSVKLIGEDFDGSVPTRVLPPLLDFQKIIHILYADIHYEGNVRRLTKGDKERLELVLNIHKGSSIFLSPLDKSFTEIAKSAIVEAVSNMDSTQILIGVLGTALILGTSAVFKSFLNKRAELRKHEISEQTKLELSKEETRRYEVLTQAMAGNRYLTEDKINTIHDSQAQMLQALKPEDEAHFLGDAVVIGTDARQIAKKEKTDSPKDVRLDGRYRILGVITTLSEGFNLKLKNNETGDVFQAIAEQANLTEQGKSLLKDATYEKEEIELQVNAQIINQQIKNAKIMKL